MPGKKYVLSDEMWEAIETFLPARKNTHPRGGGRKPRDDRQVFESILFVLRFGVQWNALNASGLCPSSTVHDRFKKWLREGVFHRLHDAGILGREGMRGIDWSWLEAGEDKRTRGPKFARMRQPRRLASAKTYDHAQDAF